MKKFRQGVLAAALGLAIVGLAGCDTVSGWFDSKEKTPLPGDRVSILALEPQISPDPEIQDVSVVLPKPYANANWPQAGGAPDRAMHHLEAPEVLRTAWVSNIGEGSSEDTRIVSPPIVADGHVFAMDAGGVISALEVGSGKRVWRFDPRPEDDDGGFGGGLAYSGNRLFAVSGYGDVFGLDPATGKMAWKQPLAVPIRAAPVVSGGRVIVVSYDNQTWALDGRDGAVLWTHAGLAETARLLGAASPAVEHDVVVVPYSSGEIYALRIENGRVAWSEALTAAQVGIESLASLNTINGSPVIDRGLVFAISHGGRLAAFDLRSGNRVWEQALSGVNTPWVAGDFLFVVTADSDVVCLSRDKGRIRWVHSLPSFENPESHKGQITWSGPILVSDRLVLVASNGLAVSLSPYDGHVLGQIELPGGARVAPIAAGGSLYVLTENADVVALR